MNQGSRLVLAFVLSMAILFGYYTFIAPPVPPQQVQNQPVAKQPEKNKQTQNDPGQLVTPPETITAQNETPQASSLPDAKETKAQKTLLSLESPLSRMELSTEGGVLTSYQLQKYRREANADSPLTNLLTDSPDSNALFLGLRGYTKFDQSKVFEVQKNEALSDGTRKISLIWQNSDIQIEKTIVVGGLKSDYAVLVDYQIKNLSQHDITISPYLQTLLRQKEQPKKEGFLSFLKFEQPDIFSRLYYKDKKLTTEMKWDDFKGGEMTTGDIAWAALSDRYFVLAMIPQTKNGQDVTVKFDRKDQFVVGQVYDKEMTLTPGGKMQGQFVGYLGPKVLDELKAVGASLEKSVDYGWFSVLAVPILWLMTFLHKMIPSWGVVIIVLTFFVKLLLHPINKKSMESMKGMQQLQPKLKEIKDKFPEDKERQNREIMQLFKTHKVNPMGGCLPMLLQMPIYIVLYKVLWNAIELYHAPFLVYKDMSAPDPYFVAPILLGIFMFLQQKLTPAATADPAQQKMMMFMPVMFTGLMLFLPVGLVIYIFVNTVMSVIQQFMIKREISFKELITGKWQPKEV